MLVFAQLVVERSLTWYVEPVEIRYLKGATSARTAAKGFPPTSVNSAALLYPRETAYVRVVKRKKWCGKLKKLPC
jgi:hypothetical protein